VLHYKCILICLCKGICIQKTFIAKKCRTNASILRPVLYLRPEEWSRKIDFFLLYNSFSLPTLIMKYVIPLTSVPFYFVRTVIKSFREK